MYDHETQGTTGEVLDAAGDVVLSAKVRFALYSYFTYIKYGHLGRGNRIPVPRCIKCKIEALHPEPTGNYRGFQERRTEETSEANKEDDEQEEE